MSGLKSFILNIEEIDGSPSVFPYKLKVTNGALTIMEMVQLRLMLQ